MRVIRWVLNEILTLMPSYKTLSLARREGNDDEHGTHHSGSEKYKKHRLKDYETIWELFTVRYLTGRLFGNEESYNYYGDSYSAVSCAAVTSVDSWNQQYPASTYRIQPTDRAGMQTAQGYLCMALQGL